MPYYRSAAVSFGPPASRVVKQLIIFTSAAFVLTYLPAVLFHWRFPPPLLGLRPFEVTRYFAIWQPVTYLFLHAGFFHLIFNLFALWMFGSDLERLWGPRRFLYYFFLTGIGAGVLNVLLEPSGVIPTVGNSGAVYGILLAYGLIFPDRPIFLWLIIPIKAKWFVAIIGVIAFIGSISGPGSGISHVAHLGGMLFGFLYLRGGGLSYGLQLRYHEWRRARLRKRFEVYMRKHEKKDEAGRWIN
ncbi:MAG: rhomboid family intramembrane serine protease [Acidobacteria bacterium]|nr:rhomboid family intramembrane serine protease [Acidobacteriota bacterium]